MFEMVILWIILTLSISAIVVYFGEIYGVGIIVGVFAGLIVMAQVLANKVVIFWEFTVPAAVIVYGASFFLTDVLAEFYGKKKAKEAVWAGFLASIILIIAIQIAIVWEPADFWKGQKAFEETLGMTWRIVLASLIAYVVSQNWDVNLFHYIKRVTKGKHLWFRNLSSTLSSQAIDTVLFITIAYYGQMAILPLIVGQYFIKLIIAGIDTPFIYAVKYIKK